MPIALGCYVALFWLLQRAGYPCVLCLEKEAVHAKFEVVGSIIQHHRKSVRCAIRIARTTSPVCRGILRLREMGLDRALLARAERYLRISATEHHAPGNGDAR